MHFLETRVGLPKASGAPFASGDGQGDVLEAKHLMVPRLSAALHLSLVFSQEHGLLVFIHRSLAIEEVSWQTLK